jgi:hypothetical protein
VNDTALTNHKNNQSKLPAGAQVLCAWPMLLLLIGGAIGGGLGGAAYALNVTLNKSNLPLPAKVTLNLLTGLAAIFIWAAIAAAIRSGRR